MNRRGFFGRGAALAISAGIPFEPSDKPAPQSLRDLETIEAGHPLGLDVKAIFLDGTEQKYVTRWNVAEGWMDVIPSLKARPVHIERRYGKVTYTLREP